jgi:drug/metabolite transporter (DMT)-like permease
MSQPVVKPHREVVDWAMLLALTLMWGSAFMFTKIAVVHLPPALIVTIRLFIATAVLVPLALARGFELVRGPRSWLFLVAIAIVGNVLPFLLVTWGQRFIQSGLTGILMAIMPLATLGLAHLLIPGERLTPWRIGGFMLGFSGVVLLIGPEALLAVGGDHGPLLPMLAVLAGAICYGVSSILARLRPLSDAVSTATTVTLLAALLSLPVLAWSAVGGALDRVRLPLPWDVIGALLFLGLLSTATAMIVYFRLIQLAGPTFVSQLNYLIPLWAVAIGVVALGEQPTPDHLYGLGLILTGILVTRKERFRRPTRG